MGNPHQRHSYYAISTDETRAVKEPATATTAAAAITALRAALMAYPPFKSLSEHHPPILLAIPRPRKGIQNKFPTSSNGIPRCSFKYFGAQNMIKYSTGSSRNRISMRMRASLFFRIVRKGIVLE